MKEAATRIRNNASTGIQRTDNDRNGTHGWVVRMQRRGRVFIKCFSDGVYGGKAQAYRAAIKHRDGIITNHPPFTRGEYADILRTNNTSGVPGVCKYEPRDGAKCWIAFWTTALGKRKSVKFSVNKYGDKRAFDLAVSAREHAIEKLTEPLKHSPSSRPERIGSSR